MIAVDTNLLLYAHRHDSPWHEPAYALIARLAEGNQAWAIPWSCIHEFIAIATHPRVFGPPSTIHEAVAQAEAWMRSPSLFLLSESEGYWGQLARLLQEGQVSGPKVHDARIAAVCLNQGVAELWTADRDFSRFPSLNARNPLVG